MSSEDKRVTHCSKCGRYIGPVEKCPYCGAKVTRPSTLMAVKYGSLVFAIVGTLLFWQMGVIMGFPSHDINEIDKSMNYARITVNGTVVDGPRVYEADYGGIGTLYFDLDDGTGLITVAAYEDVANEMMSKDKIPGYGDRVKVKGGTVLWRGEEFRVLLSTADQLLIDEGPAREVTLSNLTKEEGFEEGDKVMVTGTVADNIDDSGYSYRFTLTKGGAYVTVYISKDVVLLTGTETGDGTDLGDLEPGHELKVRASLEYYRGWTLHVNDVTDITVEAGP